MHLLVSSLSLIHFILFSFSARLNNVFTLVNLLVILFVIGERLDDDDYSRTSRILNSHMTPFLLCCVILYDPSIRVSRVAPL